MTEIESMNPETLGNYIRQVSALVEVAGIASAAGFTLGVFEAEGGLMYRLCGNEYEMMFGTAAECRAYIDGFRMAKASSPEYKKLYLPGYGYVALFPDAEQGAK